MKGLAFSLALLICAVFSHSVKACIVTPLNDREIVYQISGWTIVAYTRSGGHLWREYVDPAGSTLFRRDGGKLHEGRWKVEDGRVCFSYGTFREWSCKVVLDVSGCRAWNGLYLVEGKLADWEDYYFAERALRREAVGEDRFDYSSKIIEILPGRAVDGR